jgi:hypothetical protein
MKSKIVAKWKVVMDLDPQIFVEEGRIVENTRLLPGKINGGDDRMLYDANVLKRCFEKFVTGELKAKYPFTYYKIDLEVKFI